jgi:aminoglycoside phosphotransferase
VLLFGIKGGKAVAVHAALSHDRRRLIHQLCVGTAIGAEALPEYVPAIIERGADHIATERIEGRALMPWGKPEKDLQAAILLALEPLRKLHSRRNLVRAPDSDYVRALGRFVQRHRYRSELSTALRVFEQWNRSGLGSVTVHGDYWLNNILGSRSRVTAILDWDRARRNGSPAFDALHLGFMSYAMWADKYVSDLLTSIWTNKWEYPWLAQYTKRIVETFAVSMSDLQGTAALLWLSYFYHEADVEPPAEWYEHMIEPVCRALSSKRAAGLACTSHRITFDS